MLLASSSVVKIIILTQYGKLQYSPDFRYPIVDEEFFLNFEKKVAGLRVPKEFDVKRWYTSSGTLVYFTLEQIHLSEKILMKLLLKCQDFNKCMLVVVANEKQITSLITSVLSGSYKSFSSRKCC